MALTFMEIKCCLIVGQHNMRATLRLIEFIHRGSGAVTPINFEVSSFRVILHPHRVYRQAVPCFALESYSVREIIDALTAPRTL